MIFPRGRISPGRPAVVKSEREGYAMEQTARPQIFRYVTKDKVLDIGDLLDPDPKRSKVRFILLQFGQDFKATTRALHCADADDLEVVCWDILHGTFREWADHKGSIRDGTCQARVLSLRKDPKYDNPYVLQIRNGPGQVIGQGAVKMLKAEVSLSLLLPEFDARRLSLVILDYIRAWKQVHFADLAVARAAAGERARAQASAPDQKPPSAAAGTAHSPTVPRPGSPLERSGTPSRNGPQNPAPRRHRPSGHVATDSQVAFLLELAADLGHRGERGRLWLAEQADETPVDRLTRGQASQLIEQLLAMREAVSSHVGQPLDRRLLPTITDPTSLSRADSFPREQERDRPV